MHLAGFQVLSNLDSHPRAHAIAAAWEGVCGRSFLISAPIPGVAQETMAEDLRSAPARCLAHRRPDSESRGPYAFDRSSQTHERCSTTNALETAASHRGLFENELFARRASE